MYRLINAVSENSILSQYENSAALEAYYRSCGCDGLEVIRCGEDECKIVTPDMVVGCHLVFYSDWVDFWLGREDRLKYKFGSDDVIRQMYMCDNREDFIAQFKADMDYAQRMGAKYAVFHVSDVSIDEGYTYTWEHTDKEVIDASIELLNICTDGADYSFELLLENLWWKGFSFTDPDLTKYMLDKVHYENKGIMLDTGHLMNANTSIRSQAEGCDYIHRCLDEHGELSKYIRGMHLHQSVSGAYVEEAIKNPPPHDYDYFRSFAEAYDHILTIDTHKPFTDPAIRGVVERIAPEYLCHELSAKDNAEKAEFTRLQNAVLDGKI